MLRPVTVKVAILAISFWSSLALDVEISGVNCTSTLPVSATDFQLLCNGEPRCTFGEEATVFGELVYDSLEDNGVVDNYAYITSDLDFVTLNFHLFQMMPVQLCYDGLVVADEGNVNGDCPADGTYSFTSTYTLPPYEEKTAWLATGWTATGEISMYAEQNVNTLIGYCTFDVKPMVTRSTAHGFDAPSAATTAGIIGGLVGLALLICLYCSCRKWCSKDKEDNDASSFKRMDGDNATQYSGGSSTAPSRSAGASKV